LYLLLQDGFAPPEEGEGAEEEEY